MPQHLTCVRAAQLISGAEVRGDYTGSTELFFSPGEVKGGNFFFDIGTAGSTSLVLQTLIPAIVFSKLTGNPISPAKGGKGELLIENSTITLKGGTHVPFSPSYHFLAEVFAHYLKMIGIEIKLSIESYGFYPKGGGQIRADLRPAQAIKPLKIPERGDILRLSGHSGVGNLPMTIAERQRNAITEKILSDITDFHCPLNIGLLNVATSGQGTFLFLLSEAEHSVAGFTSLGERGKRAETVGEETANEFTRYYSTGAALDPHMSDQIILYLSICKEESVFTTSCITEHLMTNLWVTGLFNEFTYSVEGEIGNSGTVRVNPLTV